MRVVSKGAKGFTATDIYETILVYLYISQLIEIRVSDLCCLIVVPIGLIERRHQ